MEIETDEEKTRIRMDTDTQSHVMLCAIWYNLCNLKEREKHPWRSVTFSKVAGFRLQLC